MLVHFDLGFEMMPGTGGTDLTPDEQPFQAEQPASSAGAGCLRSGWWPRKAATPGCFRC
jgi:hypothetical protein